MNTNGRPSSPSEKMKEGLKLVSEAFDDEGRERREMESRVDALREHSANLSAGVEAIVHMTMVEDVGDRSPDEVYAAVMKRLLKSPD